MGEKLMTAQVDLLVVIFDDPQQANKILPELKRLGKKDAIEVIPDAVQVVVPG